jgi:hypothetical protein
MATKSALVLLAEGAEEVELVISVDILRRTGVSNLHVNIVLINFFYNWDCIVISIESELFVLMRVNTYIKLQLEHSRFYVGVLRVCGDTHMIAHLLLPCTYPPQQNLIYSHASHQRKRPFIS